MCYPISESIKPNIIKYQTVEVTIKVSALKNIKYGLVVK